MVFSEANATAAAGCPGTCIHATLQGDWLELVAPHIQERIARYAAHEIRFNLMAVVADRMEALQAQLDCASAQRSAVESKLAGGGEMDAEGGGVEAAQPPGSSSDVGSALPDDRAALQELLAEASAEVTRCGKNAVGWWSTDFAEPLPACPCMHNADAHCRRLLSG